MAGEREFTDGDITVVWKPDVCEHSGNCVRGLPGVFKPGERPWVKVEAATPEEIRKTIDTCPSGALSYKK
jgi:uncharacterized Fe-S cluster protein YjdI